MTAPVPSAEQVEAAREFFGCVPHEHGRACWKAMPPGTRACDLLAALILRLTAEERERAARRAEVSMHSLPDDPKDDDPLDKVGRYSNGTCRIIAAAIRAGEE